jgi:hypothetical protein
MSPGQVACVGVVPLSLFSAVGFRPLSALAPLIPTPSPPGFPPVPPPPAAIGFANDSVGYAVGVDTNGHPAVFKTVNSALP